MMAKTQTKRIARLKFLLVIPATAILIMCFAFSANKEVFSLDNSDSSILTETELSSKLNQNSQTEKQDPPIFRVVEKMPEFDGGEIALQKYLNANISYPEIARKEGVQGRVYVTYVVETDGSITDVRLLKGIGGGCDEEAMRVITNMPKWTPGTQRGQAVRVQFNLPVRFILDDQSTNEVDTNSIVEAVKMAEEKGVKLVFQMVEEMPQFDGGNTSLADYLSANIKYPEAALEAKIAGTVYVTFVVEKDGSITGIKLLKGIGGGCDEEAIRVVESMPKWMPGKQRGEVVVVQYNLPINFRLK